ncbi:MAG: tRNA1(Val) (adenine(37)-N6)-methyltransferase [Clostridiales bacterium]|nr:tRNA1(Val) (adenine(37)-N6)-methyltransferase [Clostridiales bacterium]
MTGRVAIAEGERVDDLRRGGLKIIQDPAAPCFALDAVLLADFAKPRPGDNVADLGTGTGVIALLLAAKEPDCRIRALEMMPQMADMARRSVALNGLAGHIDIIEGDMRQAAALLGKGSCRLVVSNPPYYAAGSGRENAGELFAAARSEVYCAIEELAKETAALLVPGGEFCLIHRAVRLAEVLEALYAAGLRPQILRQVQPFAGKPANLFLLKAQKGGKGETVLPPPLIIYESLNKYTEEMQQIYG